MISFESDYNNGMLPEILEALGRTNDEKTSGYGFDPYTEAAKKKICKAIGMDDAEVCFLVGGTQTNTTVIDSVLMGCEGVISVETGHIEVHESGRGSLWPQGHHPAIHRQQNECRDIDRLYGNLLGG